MIPFFPSVYLAPPALSYMLTKARCFRTVLILVCTHQAFWMLPVCWSFQTGPLLPSTPIHFILAKYWSLIPHQFAFMHQARSACSCIWRLHWSCCRKIRYRIKSTESCRNHGRGGIMTLRTSGGFQSVCAKGTPTCQFPIPLPISRPTQIWRPGLSGSSVPKTATARARAHTHTHARTHT